MKLTQSLLLTLALLTGGLCSQAAGAAGPQNPRLDFAEPAMMRAVLDFGKTSVSRPQLLAEFQAVLTNYPTSPYQQRAEQTVAVLTRMIAEDDAHAKIAPTNLDLLPVEDRVRELIFQLREQNGRQLSQPGACDIFNDPRICDTAGVFLNQLWPERYHFDFSASLEVRDAQRIECQNVWKKAHKP